MKLFRLFKDYPQDVDDLKIWIKNLYGLSVYSDKIIANDNLVRFLLCIFFPEKTYDEISFLVPCTAVRLYGIPKDTLFMHKEDWDSVFLSKDVDIVLFIV